MKRMQRNRLIQECKCSSASSANPSTSQGQAEYPRLTRLGFTISCQHIHDGSAVSAAETPTHVGAVISQPVWRTCFCQGSSMIGYSWKRTLHLIRTPADVKKTQYIMKYQYTCREGGVMERDMRGLIGKQKGRGKN